MKFIFSVIFFVAIFANTSLFFHYEHTRPTNPDPLSVTSALFFILLPVSEVHCER
jgi:hypothetical protein